MTVAVIGAEAVVDRGEAGDDASGELRVRRADAGVDDIGFHARAGWRVVIVAIERKIALIDSVESPGGAGLSRSQADDAIFLNKCDPRIVREPEGLLFRHAHGEAFERELVRVRTVAIATEIA